MAQVNLDKSHNPRLNGHVTLVGAGPGDAELLTLKAAKAIRHATVLFVDDLVNPDILAHASPLARIVPVGKRGGCVSTPQVFIEKLMIMAARDGEQVVRLKGGDPFIFGRGGEELAHLRDAGIEVSVINGITSGVAACTSLSIPLTQRAQAHGVVFVTGHNQPGDSSTDWAALARAAHSCKLTLVIYMGIANIDQIQTGLMQGLPSETGAAIIQRASLPDQRQASCTLTTLGKTVAQNNFTSPAIVVIGDVVAAAQVINEPYAMSKAMAA